MGRLIRVKASSQRAKRRKAPPFRHRCLNTPEPYRAKDHKDVPSVCVRRFGGPYFVDRDSDLDKQRANAILEELINGT